MDDLRGRLLALDDVAVPDLWPEIARRAAQPDDSLHSHATALRVHASLAHATSVRRTLTMLPVGSLVVAVIATTVALSAALLSLEAGPGASPVPSLEPEGAIVWDSGSVRLEAEAIEIRAGDKAFIGQPPYDVRSDFGDETRRTLEVEWTEDGLEQRLYLYLAADEQDWWVSEIRTYDGGEDADWLVFDELGLAMATPRGQTFAGDLHLPNGKSGRDDRRVRGELTITGLQLTAFAPGSGPAPLTGCEPVRASERGDAEPLDEGQPLAGTGIEAMAPADAEAVLRDSGLCFTFRYVYRTSEDDPSVGYGERWCVAPPAGRIYHVVYTDDDGEVVVFVDDDRVLPERAQPPAGWGCEEDG